METKLGTSADNERRRKAITIAIVLVFVGFLLAIPIKPLVYETWAKVFIGTSLVLGVVFAWVPRRAMPRSDIFAAMLSAISISLTLVFFEPVLRDPLMPAAHAIFLTDLRTAAACNVFFWLPSFVHALGATFAVERQA